MSRTNEILYQKYHVLANRLDKKTGEQVVAVKTLEADNLHVTSCLSIQKLIQESLNLQVFAEFG